METPKEADSVSYKYSAPWEVKTAGGGGGRNDADGDGRGIGGEWCIKRSRGCSGRRRLHIGRDIRGCRRSRSRGESWGG